MDNFEFHLEEATQQDQTWQPEIFMPMDTANNFHDLVLFLKPTTQDEITFLTKQHPKGSSFVACSFFLK